MTRISRFGWSALAVAVLAPWAVLLWIYRTQPSPSPSAPLRTSSIASTPKSAIGSSAVRAGPWGKIEARQIVIEPPEEFIPVDYRWSKPRWVFNRTTGTELRALWESAQLSAEQRAIVEDPKHRTVSADSIVIEPPVELVLELSPEARQRIYTALAAFPDNGAQREPFRFRSETLADWFVESGLPDDIVALTQKLIYRRNGTAFFSDYDVVLPRISESSLRTLYLKTLSRKTALLLTLQVDRDTDIDALAAYWGRGRRAKDVRPLLQSLARQPEGGSLDVVHLVPRFARSLLYTFPLPSDDPNSANRDCHWTSFNFYREEPDDRFTDIDFVKQTLVNEYYPVAGPAQLGDVLMFVQPGGVVIHSCVYIADDIVFTKNGPSFAVPWQFAKLDTVLSFYSVGDATVDIRRYRPKHQ